MERSREELAHYEEIFEAKIRLFYKEIERECHVTIQTLQEDLDISTRVMEQQSNDFEKDKTLLACTQSRLQAQLKDSME